MHTAALLARLLLAAPLTAVAAPAASAAPAAPASTRAVAGQTAPAADGTQRDRRLGLRRAASGASLTSGVVRVPSNVAVLGITWDEGTGAGARLTYRVERAGVWGPWQKADVELCSDCGESAAAKRAGSEPIVMTDAQRAEVRLTATGAVRPRLTVIDPNAPSSAPISDTPFTAASATKIGASAAGMALSSTSSATAAKSARAASGQSSRWVAVPAGLGGPHIAMPVKRAGWRAARTHVTESLGAPRGVVVHHTAGTNNYSAAQVPGILRGIQRFHIQDRGWSDIGYNALVDRFGRVWEGRPGGVGAPHRGAHAKGVNETYLGFAYMGDTNAAPATQAGVDAMTDLIAWTSARYGFDPQGTLRVNGRSKPVVVGHYQVGSTSCPGKDLTRRLPTIRNRAAVLSDRYLAEGRERVAAGRR